MKNQKTERWLDSATFSESERKAWRRHGRSWLTDMVGRLARDLDCLVAVTGEEGEGKSTLALRLGTLLDSNLWLDQIHNDARSFRDDARERPDGSVIILDEAFDGALNRDHQSSDNKGFVRWLGEARALRHFMIVCFPRYQNLDPYLRNHRVAYRLHVPRRGVAEVYRMEHDKFGRRDPWHDLVSVFTFGSMEHHPLWPHYQAQKVRRIREEDDGAASIGTGLTRGAIRKAARNGYLEPVEAARCLIREGCVASFDAAAIELACYADPDPHEFHPDAGPGQVDLGMGSRPGAEA